MSKRFELQLARGTAAVNRWAHAPEGRIALHPHDWAHGAMASLYGAELLAAEAGVVPFLTLDNGEKGVPSIGGARSKLHKASREVAVIYRAMHATVRLTHATAAPARPNVPELGALLEGHPIEDALMLSGLEGVDPELGFLPAAAIVVIVLGVAGLIAGAWYLREEKKLEVEGKNTRFIAAITQLADLGREQLRLTGKIDKGLISSLEEVADKDTGSDAGTPWPIWAGGALLCAAGGGYAYHRITSGSRRGR
jgi:hypothetical protein